MSTLLRQQLPQFCYCLFALNLLRETVAVNEIHAKLLAIFNILGEGAVWNNELMQPGVAAEQQMFASAIVSINQASAYSDRTRII